LVVLLVTLACGITSLVLTVEHKSLMIGYDNGVGTTHLNIQIIAFDTPGGMFHRGISPENAIIIGASPWRFTGRGGMGLACGGSPLISTNIIEINQWDCDP
jgi:hypothetical protein